MRRRWHVVVALMLLGGPQAEAESLKEKIRRHMDAAETHARLMRAYETQARIFAGANREAEAAKAIAEAAKEREKQRSEHEQVKALEREVRKKRVKTPARKEVKAPTSQAVR